MRVSLNFLKEFIDIRISPAKLTQLLTMAGMEVESLNSKEGDWIFDIEVTTNRYDWLSILGIAYETAAILGEKVKFNYPALKKEYLYKEREIIIEDKKDCPYYVARAIGGLKIGQSSGALKVKITHCGINSVNNAVDVTNYAMLKWGNPLHAFDADKIEGNIHIRRAKKGESFIGIDSARRTLGKDNLVIADSKKVIALAGIMGSKNSEVDERTKNILLEAAIFSPLVVRRSRRLAGLESESSYRFERRVSPENLNHASYEAAGLIARFCGGATRGLRIAGKKPKSANITIGLDIDRLKRYLGLSIPKPDIKRILKNLGFSVKDKAKGEIKLKVPAHRFDLRSRVDVYEEICRIYGYEKIPAVVPFLSRREYEPFSRCRLIYELKNNLGDYLSRLGFKEIVTYSFVSGELCQKLTESPAIEIVNPLRRGEDVMRGSLIFGMAQSLKHNLNRNQRELAFFEIANIYNKAAKDFIEEPALGMVLSTQLRAAFKLKGALQNLLSYFGVRDVNFEPAKLKGFSSALGVSSGKSPIGFMGKLSDSAAGEFGIKESVFFAQIKLEKLAGSAGEKKYRPFSSYPAVCRDISICLRRGVRFSLLEEIIRKTGKYLVGLEVVDTYKGKGLPSDSKIFTLRLSYQSPDKTLTSQEIDSLHTAIRQELNRREGITLR